MTSATSALTAEMFHRSVPGSAPGYSNGGDHTAVLTSWKDIARYMGKGVRTVQRWEQDFGLPVRRPHGSNKKAILARPCDLDTWVAMRCTSRTQSGTTRADKRPDHSGGADGSRPERASLASLCALRAEIETSRLLRNNNRILLREMRLALSELRANLRTIHDQDRAQVRS
jgi:hypothetical protein